MKDELIEGLKKLRPPASGATAAQVQAWRWFVASISGATTLALILHIAIACGYLTAVHPGFAKASDLQEIRDERRNERVTDLEAKILEAREKQCSLMAREQPPQLKALYTANLQKMLVEYLKLTGTAYPLPACTDYL